MKSNRLQKILIYLIIFGLIGTGFVATISSDESVSKGTIYVDDDADSSWYDETHVRTIQEGIDNASIGDTVFVYNGTYFERIVINRSINLIGENKLDTVIDNNGASWDIISVQSDNIIIQNLTCRNSKNDNAINLLGRKNVTIKNCIFHDVEFGINLKNSAYAIIQNCSFDDVSYYAIYATLSSTYSYSYGHIISDCSFLNTSCGLSIFALPPHIYLNHFNDSLIINNTFISNINAIQMVADNVNGDDTPSIYNNIFKGNSFLNNEVGIKFINSKYDNNTFYLNNFINNLNDVYGPYGIWDNGTHGNYWDTYTGIDADGDGVGDTPYLVNGTTFDNYPLVNPNGDIPLFNPVADFGFMPESPFTTDEINFTDNSYDIDGSIVNWSWDFGDGNTSFNQNPTHQYINPGNYTVCLNVADDDGFSDEICKQLTVIEQAIEELDVNQSVSDRGFPIRHALDGDWAAAQNFTPNLNTLTKAEIYLRKFGTPEFNLTVELRENHPQGTLIDTLTFTPEEVPSSWEWFQLNFEDTIIESDTNLFIVIPPAPSGVTTSFGYEWGYAFGNQYDDGAFWFTRDGGGLWRDLPEVYEFAFRTYGYS
jgi:parallel beta-helix repeat protein